MFLKIAVQEGSLTTDGALHWFAWQLTSAWNRWNGQRDVCCVARHSPRPGWEVCRKHRKLPLHPHGQKLLSVIRETCNLNCNVSDPHDVRDVSCGVQFTTSELCSASSTQSRARQISTDRIYLTKLFHHLITLPKKKIPPVIEWKYR